MEVSPLSNEALSWRIENIEKRADNLERVKASKESVTALKEDIQDLKTEVKDEVKGLRRVLIGVAAAWLFGTISFMIAVFQVTTP